VAVTAIRSTTESLCAGEGMAIAGRHGDRFVTRRFLNLFDCGAGYRQPRTEGMPVAVPNVAAYASLFETRLEP